MANYLDFLVALDEHIARSTLGFVIYGHELYFIAQQAGLSQPGDCAAAQWTGQLVHAGYAVHGPLSAGDRRPLPPGTMWAPEELSRVSDYRITAAGRTEADRIRRQRREKLTDATLGGVLPELSQSWMSEPQRRAVLVPAEHLRSALDAEQYAAAVGAAKDLVEAACKVAIEKAGGKAAPGASLPILFKQARTLTIEGATGEKIGRGLAATVQRLAELRNDVGSGHGRAAQPHVERRVGRLAATAACGIALFMLDIDA